MICICIYGVFSHTVLQASLVISIKWEAKCTFLQGRYSYSTLHIKNLTKVIYFSDIYYHIEFKDGTLSGTDVAYTVDLS